MKITVDFDIEDWRWLCELLNEVTKQEDIDDYAFRDAIRLLSTLKSVEEGHEASIL